MAYKLNQCFPRCILKSICIGGLNASARMAANTDPYGNVEATFETGGSNRAGGNIGVRMRF